ncbi:hypothetical protein CDO73_04330 [Saccharibacillus sp. O23]|uniref:hypothetical protein n=1 Tax=Saccharibacillus sp. O23 TaxID=2009338 RepID=UPI000B4E2135|nr:hypothetical protein [Saccharibacillus sp. O23]OWR31716.1 hypothetical protein CDO73_04330 [Saccharibacillus sp. O23]
MNRNAFASKTVAALAVAALVCLANYLISWCLGGVLGKFPFEADSLWSVRSGVIFAIAFVFALAGNWKISAAKRRA